MSPPDPDLRHSDLCQREVELRRAGYKLVAGVDEAGAGPLAGPLVAAAVALRSGRDLKGVDDSKSLKAREREYWAERIRTLALAHAISVVSSEEIDEVGPYQGALRGMTRAVEALELKPDYILIDARRLPDIKVNQEAVIGGDRRHLCIAAASILAKVHRDKLMVDLDLEYPGYGFAQHKGYGTIDHLIALRQLGPSPAHRRRYGPVRELLGDETPRLFDY